MDEKERESRCEILNQKIKRCFVGLYKRLYERYTLLWLPFFFVQI